MFQIGGQATENSSVTLNENRFKRWLDGLVVLAILAAWTTQVAAASQPVTVVIAPLHVGSGNPDDRLLGELSAELLTVALANQKEAIVLERARLDDVLKEQHLSLSALAQSETAVKIGKLLTADLVVAGSVVAADSELSFVINVIAVEGRRVVGSVKFAAQRNEFDTAALQLSRQVVKLIGVPLPEIKPEELDDSPDGRLHLMRGIGFYHGNNPDQAIVYCLRAVRLDPRLQVARLWIAKSYLKSGEKEHARAELERLAQNSAAKHLSNQIAQLLKQCKADSHECH
jgi:hypothetical protein